MPKSSKEKRADIRKVVKYLEKLRKDHKENNLPSEVYAALEKAGICEMVTDYKEKIKISKFHISANVLCDWIKDNKRLPNPNSQDILESDIGSWYLAKIQAKKDLIARVKKSKLHFDFMWDHIAEQEGLKGLFDEGFKLS